MREISDTELGVLRTYLEELEDEFIRDEALELLEEIRARPRIRASWEDELKDIEENE